MLYYQVLVYGSYATDLVQPWSDIDILIDSKNKSIKF